MPFIGKILSQWRERGNTTVEAAQAERARHVAAREASAGGMAAAGEASAGAAVPSGAFSAAGSGTATGSGTASGRGVAPARPVREVSKHRYGQRTYSAEELNALFFDPFQEDAGEGERGEGAPV
jgi:hypothetical protein